MAYSNALAARIRGYLTRFPEYEIEEKRMFGGLAFMVNGKMCINVSGENLMCRFPPSQMEEVSHKQGFLPLLMKGREYKGYCYVEPAGFERAEDLTFWVNLCLDYNKIARSSKK